MTERAGRGIRAWYKRAWRWCLGPFTDPHTHLGSSVRIGGHVTLATLSRYVLAVPSPSPVIVASLVGLVIACYGLRAKSTQASKLALPAPRDPAPAPPSEMP